MTAYPHKDSSGMIQQLLVNVFKNLMNFSKLNSVAWCEIRLWAEIIKSSEETLAMHAHFHCWIQGRQDRYTLAKTQGSPLDFLQISLRAVLLYQVKMPLAFFKYHLSLVTHYISIRIWQEICRTNKNCGNGSFPLLH